ncbi:MAG: hypothetical protein CSYNP_02925 [Syntrophus sp. SKADARSKE-3]|nr:hypothetical protein [Syntrophus sp. SKADARSKE-3]
MNILNKIISIATVLFFLLSCSGSDAPRVDAKPEKSFQADSLTIRDSDAVKKIRGQVLYMPIYSNIPCRGEKTLYDLSAFIAVHNTDLHNSIRLTKVLFFNNDGKLVSDFLAKQITLGPMAATNYYVSKTDKSGTGANFLIEWMSDTPVSEPLIESVMVDCETNRGVSFLSRGKVVREIK